MKVYEVKMHLEIYYYFTNWKQSSAKKPTSNLREKVSSKSAFNGLLFDKTAIHRM